MPKADFLLLAFKIGIQYQFARAEQPAQIHTTLHTDEFISISDKFMKIAHF